MNEPTKDASRGAYMMHLNAKIKGRWDDPKMKKFVDAYKRVTSDTMNSDDKLTAIKVGCYR